MAEEKQFTIPLRKEFSKAPSYKRSEKAIKAIREFIERHMKTDEVKIGKYLNLKIFERGRKNPPPRIKVKAIKEEKFVRVELLEFPFETKKQQKEEKKTQKKKETQIETTPETPKVEEVKSDEVKKEAKPQVKESKPAHTENKTNKESKSKK